MEQRKVRRTGRDDLLLAAGIPAPASADVQITATPLGGAGGINDSGAIVGFSFGGRMRATRWNNRGVPTELIGLPDEVASYVWAINANGTIIGHSFSTSGQKRAVRWNTDGSTTRSTTRASSRGTPATATAIAR